jgi:hypothetical protein
VATQLMGSRVVLSSIELASEVTIENTMETYGEVLCTSRM